MCFHLIIKVKRGVCRERNILNIDSTHCYVWFKRWGHKWGKTQKGKGIGNWLKWTEKSKSQELHYQHIIFILCTETVEMGVSKMLRLFFYHLLEIFLCKVQPNRLNVLKAVTICAFETVFHSKLHFPPLLSAGPWCTFKSTMWMSSPQCSGSPSTEPRWPRARSTIASCRWRPQTRTAPHNTARSVTTRSPPPARPSLSIATVSRREEKICAQRLQGFGVWCQQYSLQRSAINSVSHSVYFMFYFVLPQPASSAALLLHLFQWYSTCPWASSKSGLKFFCSASYSKEM